MTKKITTHYSVLLIILFLAAFSRLIPHPSNFTPIVAMALFGAAYFNNKLLAVAMPICITWISDLVINNTIYSAYYERFVFLTDGWYWIFGTLAMISVLGFILLKRVTVANIILAAVLASILFFLVTNLACFPGTDYPQTINGLVACYKAGLPFFWNSLIGNLIYSAILFGIFEYVRKTTPALRFNS